jgi:tripartite-type tricarboxylate transporter receptor subunit TctC
MMFGRAKPENKLGFLQVSLGALAMALGACAPPAPAAPTAPPATAAKPAEPAKPAVAASAVAAPASAPTASPVVAPAASPAAKPSPAAAGFDEAAVAAFYRGKTVRIVVGLGAGGGYDLTSRLLAKYIPNYLPGAPTVIVENRPGAGSALAANTIANTEPKDGTVIGNISPTLVLRQALGQPGVEFDAGKLEWLGATAKDFTGCLVRSDIDVKSFQDAMQKEVVLASLGQGDNSNDVPLVLNSALGTKFKLVSGYDGTAKFRLAMQSKEVDGFCVTFVSAILVGDSESLSGPSPAARMIGYLSEKPNDHPLLKGLSTAESLAKTDDARTLLKAVDSPQLINKPYFMAPGVPKDRVEAMRLALAKSYADPGFRSEAERAKFDTSPSTGPEVDAVVRVTLNTQPDLLNQLKEILK